MCETTAKFVEVAAKIADDMKQELDQHNLSLTLIAATMACQASAINHQSVTNEMMQTAIDELDEVLTTKYDFNLADKVLALGTLMLGVILVLEELEDTEDVGRPS